MAARTRVGRILQREALSVRDISAKFACFIGKHSADWATLNLRLATEEEETQLAKMGLGHLTARYEVKCKNCGVTFYDFEPGADFNSARERLHRERSA